MTRLTRRAFLSGSATVAAAAAFAPAIGFGRERRPVWPDATETAAMIRRGEVSALEVVQASIRAAQALQPRLNFLVTPDYERALDKVRTATPAGPFGGVPFLIKDLNSYIGLPTRAGTRSRRNSPPLTRQQGHVDAFDRAGLVVIGKSSVPEYGLLPTTEPLAYGPTRNPWDPSRSSGGSSGGAAAAVAAGIVPVAHGSDGGGSLRIPGSCCGLFALKPSRGRMLDTRNERAYSDLSGKHVLSRSVRDSAALFALTEDSGPEAQLRPIGHVTEPLRRRLRIGLVTKSLTGKAPDRHVRAALAGAVRLVRELGHEVIPTRWPTDERFMRDFALLYGSSAALLVQSMTEATGRRPDANELEPFTLSLAEMIAATPQAERDAAMQRLQAAVGLYDPWFAAERVDVILSPVIDRLTPPIGFISGDGPFEQVLERAIDYAGFTPFHNIAGAPAMSVPLYWTADGLPIGSQFAAPVGGEALLFQLAYQLEAARPWAHRMPGISARR